jgi:hypothetical protein
MKYFIVPIRLLDIESFSYDVVQGHIVEIFPKMKRYVNT